MFSDYSSKKLMDLTDDELVSCHLSVQQPVMTIDYWITSCLEAVEHEMRQSRGIKDTSKYAPLLAGFAILDQIGSCYVDRAKVAHPTKGASIHHALYYFMNYAAMSDEVHALYALRNGLVHDASLTCNTKSGSYYIFRYDPAMKASIKLAKRPWDGKETSLGGDTVTLVNPRHFTDQISAALTSLRDCYLKRPNDLKVLQPGRDILHKYLFWVPRESNLAGHS